MRKTTLLLIIAGFVQACGTHIDVSVDRSRILNTLNPEEVEEVCSSVWTYREIVLHSERQCNLLQWAYYEPQSSDEHIESTCKEVVPELCMKADAEAPEFQPGFASCDLSFYSALELCTATLDEYLACREAAIANTAALADAFQCPPDLQRPTFDKPFECQVLQNRCRSVGSQVGQ